MSDPTKRVEVPSIFLIGTGALGVLGQVFAFIKALTAPATIPTALVQFIPAEQMAMVERAMEASAKLAPFQAIFLMAVAAFVIFGGLQMRNRTNYGVAVAGAIVAMLPCSMACCIGLPVGIWCLVVLLNDDVKKTFE